MATRVGPRVLDLGLNVLDTESTHMHICSAEPTDFANVASVTLGNKNFGAGNVCGSPANGSTTDSRKVSTAAVTDGSVTGSGTATHWAITDQTNSRLNATGPLAASTAVVSGAQWTLGSFDIELPGRTT
jgi:hypothetical protein